MDFDKNENETVVPYTDKEVFEPKDINWFQAVGLTFQDGIKDNTFWSEASSYEDTINKELDEDFGFFDRGYNKATFEYYDKLITDGKVSIDEDGNVKNKSFQINPASSTNLDTNGVALWNRLKNKGFTPDSFDDEVSYKIQNDRADIGATLRQYDEDNAFGMSGTAGFVGSVGSYLADPIQSASMVAEIALFKGAGPLIKEGISAAFKKQFGGMSKDLLKKQMKDLKIPDKHFDDLAITLNSKMAQAGKKKAVAEMFRIAGVTGGIAAGTEALHQAGTFDFKTRTQGYDVDQRNVDIAVNTTFGAVGGGIFNVVGNLIRHVPDSAVGIIPTVESAYRAASDSSITKGVEVDGVVIKETMEDITDEEMNIIVNDLNKQDGVVPHTEEWNKMKEDYSKQQSGLQKARACLLQ